MASVGPHHPLDEVKQLVAAGNFIVMKGRALELLVPPLTYTAALGFVAAAIQVCIDRTVPEVVVISFHPPQRPMRTKAGMVKPP